MGRFVSPWWTLFACLSAGPSMALGTLTTLYEFKGAPDAVNPAANIVLDRYGDIFGGTQNGGVAGAGAIFELTPPVAGQTNWSETLLGQFPDKRSGIGLYGGVVRDGHGNLYGTTAVAGARGCGSVFKMHKTDVGFEQRILWVFRGNKDGCVPSAALNMDASGALYGNTGEGGGIGNNGVVFKLAPPVSGSSPWTETVIWRLDKPVDGEAPSTQMLFDNAGNLYGTSSSGGLHGHGVVWELTPPRQGSTKWARTVLWSFNGLDGDQPTRGPLVMLPSGELIGTCHHGGAHGDGVVFELTPPAQGRTKWTESTIWAFHGDGNPTSGVARAPHGELIVPTDDGNGAIIELRPPTDHRSPWTEVLLWQFSGGDGSEPEMPPVLLPNSIIAGTTHSGGLGYGTVWQLAW